MRKTVIHRTAALLIAVVAMLPLQGIQAALGGSGDHASHAGGHEMPVMADMPGCPMHQAGADESAGGMHCSGGCKLCGACAAAVLPLLQPRFSHAADHPKPRGEAGQLPHPTYVLFRPPRH